MPTAAVRHHWTLTRNRTADVVVLEARVRLGGRSVNRVIPGTGGEAIKMGGRWIGPTQHRAVSLVAELGLDLYGTYDEGKHTVEFHGKLNRSEAVPSAWMC
jgi:monoamine oxidase